MDVPHQLETLLHFLVTDSSSITHLSYILDHLSLSSLAPSPHLHKWVTRVTSLMHSKDPAARWAAICIAYRMSFLSTSLLIDNAQLWVGIVFPSLSKPEPVPILKASIRYLSLVLSTARHDPEFQKQVAVPMVLKVSSALLTITEKHYNLEIKILSIQTVAQLVPLYPSLHKALNQRLFGLCSQMFSGSVHGMTDDLLGAIVDLYAILHCIGGKVGGINLWRNCLDEILAFSWSAWLNLRTTFPTSAQLSHKATGSLRPFDSKLLNSISHTDTTTDNPMTTAALNLDRLNCGVRAIGALLRAPVTRPVKVPVGHLTAFCWCLLASVPDDEGQSHFDPSTRLVESTVITQIWMQACRLLSSLAETARELLVPHTSRLIMIMSSHLENNPGPSRTVFLQCAQRLLYFCPVVGATHGINRLLKATLSSLSPLYLHQQHTEMNSEITGHSKASKKKQREYEMDNTLSVNNAAICAMTNECETLIVALDVVDQCMLNAELALPTRSFVNRVLLSILLSLPLTPSSSFSSDPNFHGRVARKVREMCVESVQGTSHAMSKGAGLVLRSFSCENLVARDKLHSQVDLLLHPRRPPLVRALPLVESLSLSSAVEGTEETAICRSLHLALGSGDVHCIASGLQKQPDQVNQSSTPLDLRALSNPPQDRLLFSSTEPQPQTASGTSNSSLMEISPALPTVPPATVLDMPAGLPLSVSQIGPSMVQAPMSVDESDHEEVPAIDLGSDSDA